MTKDQKKSSEKTPAELEEVRLEIKKQTTGYILAALGLVAGLAWNDAIKAFIESFFTVGKDSIFAKFIYAGLVTIIIVIASYYIQRFTNHKK